MKRRADWSEPVAITEHPSMQPVRPSHLAGKYRGSARINPATEQEISKAVCENHWPASHCPLHMPVTYARQAAQHRADR